MDEDWDRLVRMARGNSIDRNGLRDLPRPAYFFFMKVLHFCSPGNVRCDATIEVDRDPTSQLDTYIAGKFRDQLVPNRISYSSFFFRPARLSSLFRFFTVPFTPIRNCRWKFGEIQKIDLRPIPLNFNEHRRIVGNTQRSWQC